MGGSKNWDKWEGSLGRGENKFSNGGKTPREGSSAGLSLVGIHVVVTHRS